MIWPSRISPRSTIDVSCWPRRAPGKRGWTVTVLSGQHSPERAQARGGRLAFAAPRDAKGIDGLTHWIGKNAAFSIPWSTAISPRRRRRAGMRLRTRWADYEACVAASLSPNG